MTARAPPRRRDGRGRPLDILHAGDLNPALRALLPAAVQSALHGNPDPLLRLKALSEGLIPTCRCSREAHAPNGKPAKKNDERAVPRHVLRREAVPLAALGARPPTREAEARRRAARAAERRLLPVRRRHRVGRQPVPVCLDWPDASPAPPAAGPLPNVPTLILSGAQDLRTPTSNARRIAAGSPTRSCSWCPTPATR